MAVMLALLLKRFANVLFMPTWCAKCGTRLVEQPIGFRELGSRYRCANLSCALHNLPTLVLGA
jgi:NAD-dependent DNA ligase